MLQPERRTRTTIGDGSFVAGTRIGLPSPDGAGDGGEAAIEELAADDMVRTLGGAAPARTVREVGQRRVDHGAQADGAQWGRTLMTPVRVRAGAIGPDMPRRDLLLPPEALLLFRDLPGEDGGTREPVLVPVGALVNGGTIVHAPPAAALNWCALELDAHDVVLAENLPVATVRPMLEDAPGRRQRPCAPVLLPGAELVALRARLGGVAAQARERDREEDAVIVEPEIVDDETRVLRLFTEGGEIEADAEPIEGDYRFVLPEGTGAVRLVSPQRASPAPRDTRRLGVAVMRLALDGAELALDGPELGRGFHPAEGNEKTRWRWTDGRAWLALPHSTAERRLEVRISDWHLQLKK